MRQEQSSLVAAPSLMVPVQLLFGIALSICCANAQHFNSETFPNPFTHPLECNREGLDHSWCAQLAKTAAAIHKYDSLLFSGYATRPKLSGEHPYRLMLTNFVVF